jgi:hypothetical protein
MRASGDRIRMDRHEIDIAILVKRGCPLSAVLVPLALMRTQLGLCGRYRRHHVIGGTGLVLSPPTATSLSRLVVHGGCGPIESVRTDMPDWYFSEFSGQAADSTHAPLPVLTDSVFTHLLGTD